MTETKYEPREKLAASAPTKHRLIAYRVVGPQSKYSNEESGLMPQGPSRPRCGRCDAEFRNREQLNVHRRRFAH